MTQEEIQEYNKRCAEFIELELTGPGFSAGYFYKNNFYQFHELKFHSDWNWIMEVVEKIERLTVNTRVRIESHSCKLTHDNYSNIEIGLTKKEAVIQTINHVLTNLI